MATVTLEGRLATMLYYLNRGIIVNIKELSEEFEIATALMKSLQQSLLPQMSIGSFL